MQNIYLIATLYFLIVIIHFISEGVYSVTEKCSLNKCFLPDCWCSSTKIPGNLPVSDTPQFVILSFNGAVRKIDLYSLNQILKNKRNPNKCPIKATFYVTHNYTDYSTVHQLYEEGHEIGVNSFTYRYPSTWWKNATSKEWKKEMMTQKAVISHFSMIPETKIRGLQTPHLQSGGDQQMDMMKEAGFLYDNSWPSLKYSHSLWPYTLDFSSIQDCPLDNCPREPHDGTWIIPLTYYKDKNNRTCEVLAACSIDTEDDVYNLLNNRFVQFYTSNHAPMSITITSSLLQYPEVIKGIERFLSKLHYMKDVFVSSSYQVIKWIQNPISLKNLIDSNNVNCLKNKNSSDCKPKNCKYLKEGQERYFKSCLPCPVKFPSLENPFGEATLTTIK